MEHDDVIQLSNLDAERTALSREISELQQRLDEAQQRRQDIETLLSTWARIRGDQRESPTDPDVSRQAPAGKVQPIAVSGTKRIPSTRMVVDLVHSQRRAWTREEIHRAFEESYGIPESWTNPTNAINNAILRGVQSGRIREDGDVYRAV